MLRLVLRRFQLALRRFQLVLLRFQLVLLRFQLVLLRFQHYLNSTSNSCCDKPTYLRPAFANCCNKFILPSAPSRTVAAAND